MYIKFTPALFRYVFLPRLFSHDVPLVEFISVTRIYSHAQVRVTVWVTQVFYVVFMCAVFQALINSLVFVETILVCSLADAALCTKGFEEETDVSSVLGL